MSFHQLDTIVSHAYSLLSRLFTNTNFGAYLLILLYNAVSIPQLNGFLCLSSAAENINHHGVGLNVLHNDYRRICL